MISKQEIISVATATHLLPTTVEKDYVLGWVLYGISKHRGLSKWVFKGGTCLKKCYFETYRFSEDLDFTVPKNTLYDKAQIQEALKEITEIVYQDTGINLLSKEIEIKESINKRSYKTYVAKLTYLGPLGLASRSQQRIKFDISNDEILLDQPDLREVFHSYSDAPSLPVKINCYSINEILAEKSRAIYERQGRARDIYDIVHIGRDFKQLINIEKTQLILKEKFKFKQLPEPSANLIISQIDFSQLEKDWQHQLGHQITMLPPAKSFYDELHSALTIFTRD